MKDHAYYAQKTIIYTSYAKITKCQAKLLSNLLKARLQLTQSARALGTFAQLHRRDYVTISLTSWMRPIRNRWYYLRQCEVVMASGTLGRSHYRGEPPAFFKILPVVEKDFRTLMWIVSYSGDVRNLLCRDIKNPTHRQSYWMNALVGVQLGESLERLTANKLRGRQ